MKQRGRTSTAAATVAQIDQRQPTRPQAIKGLSARAAEVWQATTNAMPADWFTAEQLPQLAAYCGHVERSERWTSMLDAETDLEALDRLTRMIERENRAALALARSMRLTKQARLDRKQTGNVKPQRPHIQF